MSAPPNLGPKCSDCPIRHRAVCARCDVDELEQLERIKTYKDFKAGEPIFWRGEQLTSVASIVTGVATLSKSMEDGRTQLVGLLMPSDFIGRPGRDAVEFDVTATTDVSLCMFQRGPFEKILAETPHLSERLMELALDELDAARDWMVLLGRKTAHEKIATFIQMLVIRSDKSNLVANRQPVKLPLSRDQIANYLGLTLETVSRHFNALKKEGILALNDRRSIEVLDLRRLRAQTGDDSDV